MKRISFFVVILLALLAAGMTVQAQVGQVYVKSIDGLYKADTLNAGQAIKFNIAFRNDAGFAVDVSNGYKVYTPDGAQWDSVTIDTVPPNIPSGSKNKNWFHLIFDQAFSKRPQLFTNTAGTAQVMCLGAGTSGTTETQYQPGWDSVVYKVSVWQNTNADVNNGKHLCFDSAFFPPSGTWVWSYDAGGGSIVSLSPTWTNTVGGVAYDFAAGGYCYPLYKVPDLNAVVVNTGTTCPAAANWPPAKFTDVTLTQSHCVAFAYDFDVCDKEGDTPYAFALQAPIVGTIDAATGMWGASLATGDYSVKVAAKDNVHLDYNTDADAMGSLTVHSTNAAPTISCPGAVNTNTGRTEYVQVTAADADACDPKIWSIVAGPGAGATASVDGTGKVTFQATEAGDYTVTVGVSDGIVAQPTACDLVFHVSASAFYQVRIPKLHDVHQGEFKRVDVQLLSVNQNTTGGLGGFNILIAYDNSALSLQSADINSSALYSTCGWEYFTYRFGYNGNCGNGCPSGIVRAIGIAETNNGAHHPSQACVPNFVPSPLPVTMFTLTFLVSNDRTLQCAFVPIRFFWVSCVDNTLSNFDGSQLYIEKRVYDYYSDTKDTLVIVDEVTFPGYAGVPVTDCDTGEYKDGKLRPDRNIDFYNGGIDIICSDSIDARGDINLNNVANEIADAVMFTNYFVRGLTAFGSHVKGSVAASDVNADGATLTVADLVYLIRIIVGDALPYAKTTPVVASYVNNDGILSVSEPMGAAHVVIKGKVTPVLLANNMKMDYGFQGENTSVIIYPPMNGSRTESFTGAFLNAGGEVVSIEMATAEGAPVVAKSVPAHFGLAQNYPNPFNPGTVIKFSLPTASHYTLTVYNVTGQKVAEFSGQKEAGEYSVEFNGSKIASGIYFYKLTAGNFTDTKKMVLLK